MARDNSSSQLDDHSHQMKERSTSIHFEDETVILPELDWQNEDRKHKRATLVEEDLNNTEA